MTDDRFRLKKKMIDILEDFWYLMFMNLFGKEGLRSL